MSEETGVEMWSISWVGPQVEGALSEAVDTPVSSLLGGHKQDHPLGARSHSLK